MNLKHMPIKKELKFLIGFEDGEKNNTNHPSNLINVNVKINESENELLKEKIMKQLI